MESKEERNRLIVRPQEKGAIKKTYVHAGKEFQDFRSAMEARSKALDDAGIYQISEQELNEAEAAISKSPGAKRFTGRIDLFIRGGSKDNQDKGAPSSARTDERLSSVHSESAEDGIASMIKVFAWITLVASGMLGLALFPFPGLPILFAGLFQFALLFGFARIIEYLRRIAQAAESKRHISAKQPEQSTSSESNKLDRHVPKN